MLLLGCNATVLREAGPVPVEELRAGDGVLCLQRGIPTFVPVEEVRIAQSKTAVWVYTDAGDLVVGSDSAIVTAAGLRLGVELAAMRDKQAIGRMQGGWPRLEILSARVPVYEMCDRNCQEAFQENSRSRLLSLGRITQSGLDVVRVGSHSRTVLDRFAQFVLGKECTLEPGPAGWTWLRTTDSPRTHKQVEAGQDGAAGCALTLWQAIEEGEAYRLPLEDEALRIHTLGVLYYCGVSFETEYRPRYMPLHIDLSLAQQRAPHAQIQAIRLLSECALVDVRLAERGCYLVANGLLCGL